MAVIGDLVVNLSTDASKFSSGLDQSTTGLKGFAASAKSFLNPLAIGLAAVTGAAVATGVAIYGLTSRIDALDKIAKTAARTGLSGEFLQRLEFAADQSGVAAETLTKSIGKMTINVGEAAAGTKTAADAFGLLGLSVRDLQSMSPEEQFRKVAEGISALPTAAERAAAAVRIFGRSGLEMTTLFGGGMKGINALMERAKELGIGVDAEGLKKIEAANDALGQMKAAGLALLDQVTVGLAPAFTYVATTIADMIPPVTKLFEQFNNLEDKATFLGEVLVAGIDLGIEHIKLNWEKMLVELVNASGKAAVAIGKSMIPGADIIKWSAGEVFGNKGAGDDKGGLAGAQARMDAVMAQLDMGGPGELLKKAPSMNNRKGPAAADTGAGIRDLFGSIGESLSGPLAGAKIFAQTKLTEGLMTANAIGSTVKGMFTGEPAKETPQQVTKFSSAMQKGSAEAFSTIVQAMMGGKNDPNVKATEKQTKELVKAIKLKPPNIFNMLEAITT